MINFAEFQDQLQAERRTVSFDSYDITVRQLVDMFANSELDIYPDYQRQFLWEEERQSQLIESVFLGIPIPSIYMATNADATWDVVDGVQRLCTLINYCGQDNDRERIRKTEPLKLVGLEKLSELNKSLFTELPKSVQLHFLTRPIKVTVLNDKSDNDVRFDLFERLNTGGVSLTQQEIRNCIFQGKFNEFLKQQASKPLVKSVIKLKQSDESNGTAEEFILRFFAFLENYSDFDHSVKHFLNDHMKSLIDTGPSKNARSLFVETFTLLKECLPEGIVRGNRSITPVNLYEAIAVGTALAIRDLSDPHGLNKEVLPTLLEDTKLRRLTTGATNSRKMVVGRIEYVRNALLEL
jgi:hypothetical protein